MEGRGKVPEQQNKPTRARSAVQERRGHARTSEHAHKGMF